jgi:polar amino acid transport system substrate-binding protein
MVSYFNAGTPVGDPEGQPEGQVDPDDACGLRPSAVQKGTVQVDVDLHARAARRARMPASPRSTSSSTATRARSPTSGQSAARPTRWLADLPPAIAAVDLTGGQLELLGEQYDSAPYGYVLKKEDTAFGEAIVEALKQLESEGTYLEILTKWKTEGGAINDFAVNPTVS